MKKKILCFLLGIVMGTVCITGCGRESDEKKLDESKTILTVYGIEGGVGNEWLYDIERDFEKAYEEVEFEPGSGKKGVDLDIKTGKSTNVDNVAQSIYDVYFSEAVPTFSLASSGALLPITDMVTESLSDVTNGEETISIESKLSDSYKTSLKAINNNYYMLPHFETYSGIIYNVKVFRENVLYFKQGGGWTDSANKTVGPDGVKNTADDGLPSSVEEFMTLLDRMVAKEVVPFIWSGGFYNYITRMLVGLDASIAGYDQYMLNYNFGKDSVVSTGKADIITGFDGGVPTIENVDITPNNGYKMSQRASSYYALKILEKVLSDSRYYSDLINETLSHTGAQTQFIYSDLQNTPIAMLIEGSYWYNEASDTLKRVKTNFQQDPKDLEYSIMPLPVQISGSVQEGETHTQTLVSANNSYAFLNGKLKDDANKAALAKLFLKYCYTNKQLVNFFKTTGLFKGVSTDLTGVDLSSMDYYKRSVALTKQNAKVATTISDNELTVRGLVQAFDKWGSTVTVNGKKKSFTLPLDAFKGDNKVSCEDYFTGMWISESTWNSKFSDILNK